MTSYCSLFVDAGYLMAAASTRVTGTSLRGATDMDVAGLLADLSAQVQADSGMPLLRIHWYDAGTRTGAPSLGQRDIAKLPRVKLRLGRCGYNGEQKGVDLKLALDLIAHSRNGVAEVVYLVSGDDDLSEAVEAAQDLGVQVVALVVADEAQSAIAVSQHLQMTVDRMEFIHSPSIDRRVRRAIAGIDLVAVPAPLTLLPGIESDAARGPERPTPLLVSQIRPLAPVRQVAVRPVPAYVTTSGVGGWFGGSVGAAAVEEAISFVVEKVVLNLLRGASAESRDELLKGRPVIPPEVDRTLLTDLSNKLGVYDLPQEARFALRDAFWSAASRQ
ncbi:MAG TPA: NYN domain-containing protein [Sporichthyaceae bacterium]|nr:NYN domain-containing protein [Sporichthyaceae bacterium]